MQSQQDASLSGRTCGSTAACKQRQGQHPFNVRCPIHAARKSYKRARGGPHRRSSLRPLDGGVGGASIDDPGAGLALSGPEPERRAGLAPPPPPAAGTPPAAGMPPAETAPAAVSASFASAAAGEHPMPSPAGRDDPGTNATGASAGAPAGAADAPGGKSTASRESAPGPKRCKHAEVCQAETPDPKQPLRQLRAARGPCRARARRCPQEVLKRATSAGPARGCPLAASVTTQG